MMAARSTTLAFLFLVVIHFHWIIPSFAFSPSSSFRNSPRFTSTFTRSRLFSSSPDNSDLDSDNSDSDSNDPIASSTTQNTGIGINISSNDNEDYESDDAATYYSPNAPLREKDTDTDTDSFNGADGSESEYSFFDEAVILVRSGSGGQGASTYKLMAGGMDGAPDGGSGGTGGNIILETDATLNSLAGLTQAWRPNSFGGSGAAASSKKSLRPKSFRAENGNDGDRQYKNGKFGTDIVIRVPPGTVVQEEMIETDEQGDEETVHMIDLGSLSLEVKRLVVAFGGEGGEGTGAQGKNRSIRRPRAPPTGGQRKMLKLTLKIVADVALVGVPNAGKSTFLASVTRAKPKIANYPFTTVIPNLGVWIPKDTGYGARFDDQTKGAGSDGLVLCDVPGLIKGAAQGVGLGHAFLRHVERCHVILHLVDATSNDPVADFEMLNNEISKYGTGQLGTMPQVVVVNKIDAFDGSATEDWEEGLRVKLQRAELEERLKATMPHTRLMWMSAKERDGVEDLMSRLAIFVKKVKQAEPQ